MEVLRILLATDDPLCDGFLLTAEAREYFREKDGIRFQGDTDYFFSICEV